MKRIISIVFLTLFTLGFVNAQEPQKSRKERRAERQEKRMEEVQKMLDEKKFKFDATHAMPMGGGSIHLNYSYDVELTGDTVSSYLPFYGVAYRLDYGGRDSGFDFTLPVKNYEYEKEEDGYLIQFEVKKDMDNISFTFHISELGYATLNVISTNRQAISYYGRLETINKD